MASTIGIFLHTNLVLLLHPLANEGREQDAQHWYADTEQSAIDASNHVSK
jgi:hypothetical protein